MTQYQGDEPFDAHDVSHLYGLKQPVQLFLHGGSILAHGAAGMVNRNPASFPIGFIRIRKLEEGIGSI